MPNDGRGVSCGADRREGLLLALGQAVPRQRLHSVRQRIGTGPESVVPTTHGGDLGQRVGAWVYKRDFALGGTLALADAVRHIAQPVLRQIAAAALRQVVETRCRNSGADTCCFEFHA